VAQRAVERLRLLQRQLELAQPAPSLDPEHVRHRRPALQAAHQHRVDLVLGARPRAHQLLAAREPAAHHPAALVGHPHRLQLPGPQQPRQRARVEPVGLRPRLADPRVVRTHDDHSAHVRLEDPGDLPSTAGHLQRHPILGPEASGEQLEHVRRRLDPPRRPHRPRLADRDLAEIAMHVQPDRSTDRPPHDNLLASMDGENQRANDNDRYVLAAQPGQVAGAAKKDKPALEAHRPKRPARLRSPRKPPSRVTRP
jgi:hypothetical protein